MKFMRMLALVCTAACATASMAEVAEPSLESVRAATERFRDVKVALAEGYIAPPGAMCETAAHMGKPAGMGAMGVHYFRPDLLGITTVEPRVGGNGTHADFNQPAILIYEPGADGVLQLVAVENLVFADAWHAAGHNEPPTFAGRSFDFMTDDPATQVDEAHMFEPHYDLHMWVHRDNPNGVFAQFNPKVSCDLAGQSAGTHHDHAASGSSGR